MAFKPNYGRDRADRERAARARSEEKQREKRTRKLRCAKPRAPQPNPHRMKSKANGERYGTEKRDRNRKKSSSRANWKGFSKDYQEHVGWDCARKQAQGKGDTKYFFDKQP